MADLYDLGDRPALGEVPKRMHAFAVRQSRFGARRAASGFNDDDGFGSGRTARCRQELRRMCDRFHVEQDCAALGVAGEVIQHVAEICIGHVAQRHHL